MKAWTPEQKHDAKNKAIDAKKALIAWLISTNHYELIHIDLSGLRKLNPEQKYYPELAEYEAFGSMHQPIPQS